MLITSTKGTQKSDLLKMCKLQLRYFGYKKVTLEDALKKTIIYAFLI